MKISPKELKKQLRKPGFMQEARQMQDAMLKAASYKRNNAIIFEMLKVSWAELRKKGVKKLKYKYEGKEYELDTKKEINEIQSLIDDDKL